MELLPLQVSAAFLHPHNDKNRKLKLPTVSFCRLRVGLASWNTGLPARLLSVIPSSENHQTGKRKRLLKHSCVDNKYNVLGMIVIKLRVCFNM